MTKSRPILCIQDLTCSCPLFDLDVGDVEPPLNINVITQMQYLLGATGMIYDLLSYEALCSRPPCTIQVVKTIPRKVKSTVRTKMVVLDLDLGQSCFGPFDFERSARDT